MTEPAQISHRFLRSVVLIAVLLAGGVGLASLLYAMRQEPPRSNKTTPPPYVRTVVVQAEDVVERYVGYGTARPDRVANLAAEVAATVVELVDDIEEGSKVAEGQLLIRLDDREFRHALERVEALVETDQASLDELEAEEKSLKKLHKAAEQELRVAQDEKKRLTGLFELGHSTKREYDFASAAYQRARRVVQAYEMDLSKVAPRRARLGATKRSREAEAKLVRLNLERCAIKPPFGGVIETLMVDVGDRVGQGTVLLTLIDPTHVEIPIRVPAGAYDRLHVGAPCHVECESMPGVSWNGQVARIAPSVDPQTRTFAVYVDVDNTGQELPLIPGTFVRAEVRGPIHHRRLLVPRGAVRIGRVLVVVEGVARERPVSIERLITDRALVEGSLRAGERVILSHLDRLSDGSPVRIEEPKRANSK